MTTSFDSSLPAAAATIIPLLLVAIAIEARVANQWQGAIAKSRQVDPGRSHRLSIQMGLYAVLTIGASVLGILSAAIELTIHTNELDNLILGCIFIVVLATGLSIFTRVLAAMARGLKGQTPAVGDTTDSDQFEDPRLRPIVKSIFDKW